MSSISSLSEDGFSSKLPESPSSLITENGSIEKSKFDEDDDEEEEEDKLIVLGPNSKSQIDLIRFRTAPSSIEAAVITRPRGSSFNSHLKPKNSLHVQIGGIQFSDMPPLFPTEDMENTLDNRRNLMNLLLTDARHGNLENFRYLYTIARRVGCLDLAPNSYDLHISNEESLIYAAAQSDNIEMFLEIMNVREITFKDLVQYRSPVVVEDEQHHLACSYPPKKKSALENDKVDLEGSDDDDYACMNAEDSVFGRAVEKNSISIVNLLLDNGITDNFPEGCQTALHLAIIGGHEILVKILIDRAGSRLDQTNGRLQTPLMMAVMGGHVNIANVIAQHRGAGLLLDDFEGMTVLHHAAKLGDMEMLKVLRMAIISWLKPDERSSFVLQRNRFGYSALDLALNGVIYNFILTF